MKKSSPSISVRRSLEKLGHDIRIARLGSELGNDSAFYSGGKNALLGITIYFANERRCPNGITQRFP